MDEGWAPGQKADPATLVVAGVSRSWQDGKAAAVPLNCQPAPQVPGEAGMATVMVTVAVAVRLKLSVTCR